MAQFDYLVPLIAIMVGLALADIAASLHRLVRGRGRVRWSWLPLSAAFLLILMTLETWWGLRDLSQPGQRFTIGMFLPFMIELILLYLLASAALPDEVPAEGVDLRAYYFGNRVYFWLLLAALVAIFALHRIGTVWALHGLEPVRRILPTMVPNLILLVLLLSLAYVRRPWWHALWLALLPALYFLTLFGRELN